MRSIRRRELRIIIHGILNENKRDKMIAGSIRSEGEIISGIEKGDDGGFRFHKIKRNAGGEPAY